MIDTFVGGGDAGIELGPTGAITTDNCGRTSDRGVYAPPSSSVWNPILTATKVLVRDVEKR